MSGFSSQSRSELVIIQRGSMTEDDHGQETGTWPELMRAYASVRYGSGDERRSAAQEGATQAATFGLDFSVQASGIKAKDRLVYGGNWDITSVTVEPRNKGVVLTAVRAL